MKTSPVLLFFTTVFFTPWDNFIVESANTTEAKLISAKQKTDNPYMIISEDENVRSGWVLEIKKDINQRESKFELFVYFFTKTSPEATFKEGFAIPLSTMYEKEEYIHNFILKQILDMIIPGQRGSVFKEYEYMIHESAQVNTHHGRKSRAHMFPENAPYEIKVLFVSYEQLLETDRVDDCLFEINFSIGGNMNKKQKSNK